MPLWKKYWLLNLELTEFQTLQICDKYFWGDKSISVNFNYAFLGLFNAKVPFSRKRSHF